MDKTTTLVRPFIKWAGNKTHIIEHVKRLLPPGKRLIEPFVGSGAVFLNTNYPEYLLSDSNQDLITLFAYAQNKQAELIRKTRQLFCPENNCAERYYSLRQQFNQTKSARQRAILFLYLNRHGYNGLCRYNASGGFNVPFGDYRSPRLPEERMRLFADKARQAQFVTGDFRQVLQQAEAGDVVYADPPYVPISPSANFTHYQRHGFTLQDQEDLANIASDLQRRGVSVIISNHDTPITQQLYQQANHIETCLAPRFISCQAHKRQPVRELLAVYG